MIPTSKLHRKIVDIMHDEFFYDQLKTIDDYWRIRSIMDNPTMPNRDISNTIHQQFQEELWE